MEKAQRLLDQASEDDREDIINLIEKITDALTTEDFTAAKAPMAELPRYPVLSGVVMEHCPVCRACFKGTAVCHRCGADLSPLLRIEAEAAAWEQKAVTLLATGKWIGARGAADRALGFRYSALAAAARDFAGRELVAEEKRRFEQLLQ
ncbi:MAG: hypothetical protein P9D89_01915 [Candidatus Contendobacter sp.]|nr:hypothetical protein [Candidatus Contendobacter sp.]